MAEEEHLSLEESGLLPERGGRRGRKEEPKLSDVRLPRFEVEKKPLFPSIYM